MHGFGSRDRHGLAPGGIQLLRQRYGSPAIAPVGVLRSDLVDRLGLRQLHTLLGAGQAQHLTGFKAVDIAVDKGIRV